MQLDRESCGRRENDNEDKEEEGHDVAFFLNLFLDLVCNIWRTCLTCFQFASYNNESRFLFCNLFFKINPPNMYYMCIMKTKMKTLLGKGYRMGL